MDLFVYREAGRIIAMLGRAGAGDYSKYRDRIATELIDDGLLNGRWDVSLDFYDLPNIRYIHVNEYEQHMDGVDNCPRWNDMVGQGSLGYLWIIK